MKDWVILTCAGQSTLALAASLNEDGYEAWSPVRMVQPRARSKVKHDRVPEAMVKGYVFAKAHQLGELLNLARSPSLGYTKWDPEQRRMVSRGHPRFTVYKDSDGYGLVNERDLTYLRREERKDRPKEHIRPYLPGEEVKVIDGPFQGMVGSVVGTHGLHVQIEFPRSIHLPKLPMWMLQHVDELEKAA